MKAVRIHKFGPTEDVLQFDEVPVPEAGPGELLIKVEAASLNRADLGLRSGNYRTAPEDLPIIPGREFAGRVTKLGDGVNDFQVGQRVVGYTGTGGYAEYAKAKTSEVRPLPDGVDAASAAAIPTVFLTAWFALMEEGKLRSGEWLLVQAGSSGVGIAAIQIGKHAGAKVVTTTSGDEKARRLRQLGADAVIDYTQTDLIAEGRRATGNRGFDVVLEMVGGEVYQKSIEVLAPAGRLVSIGGAFGKIPDTPPALKDGQTASRFSITNYLKAHPEGFKQLDAALQWARDGKYQAVIDRRFPLAETRAAQRFLEGRDHFGKIVLIP
jgi:NADPH2:quinone reductase